MASNVTETLTADERAALATGNAPVVYVRHLFALYDAALARAAAAEKNYRWMVEHAADQKLDGYRELGAKAASAESRLAAAVELLERVQKKGPTRGDGALNGDIKAFLSADPAQAAEPVCTVHGDVAHGGVAELERAHLTNLQVLKDLATARTRIAQAVAELEKARAMSGNRWSEWGSRAESVGELLDSALELLRGNRT